MKTIIVIYTNKKLVRKADIAGMKKYAFKTASELKEGDMISSSAYNANLQVVNTLNEEFTYYNSETGELSNNYTSTKQWFVKELIIREDNEDAVYGSIIKEDK